MCKQIMTLIAMGAGRFAVKYVMERGTPQDTHRDDRRYVPCFRPKNELSLAPSRISAARFTLETGEDTRNCDPKLLANSLRAVLFALALTRTPDQPLF